MLLLIIKWHNDGSMEKYIACGVITDEGGGGTREGLAFEMLKAGRACDLYLFLIETCALYSSNRMTESPCQKLFGNGSSKAINVIQFLHA